ncbi:SMI1/KNR4 family protein [Acetobacterium sp. UBA5834]|jgi:hypothetical protein|uniref:SMI1/KNR4 family protein n=1 Tax=Acetobacterium sp. UBA5834 TaxID=1945907 RepID=UPI00257BD343|nr:SMI1/KNR4 family protein [Acetobacterium sp. UBA5834]
MDNLDKFISNHDVLYDKERINEKLLNTVERAINVEMGSQLKKYLLNYGFLIYKFVELHGINQRQGIESDMIKVTNNFHLTFPDLKKYIVLENKGDGDYIIIDSMDNVYEYEPSYSKDVIALNQLLADYILDRFEEVENL